MRNVIEIHEGIDEYRLTAFNITLKKYNSAGELVYSHTQLSRDFDLRLGIKFVGGKGNDYFINNTRQYLYARGGDGNDTLIGGSGIDNLYGEGGNDSLVVWPRVSGEFHGLLVVVGQQGEDDQPLVIVGRVGTPAREAIQR